MIKPIYDDIDGWRTLKLHELCTLFPEAVDEDYDRLVDSMRQHGFLETDPIVLFDTTPDAPTENYVVLDGRNRIIAATDANVTPVFVEYHGDDPLGFVTAKNLDRRHLTAGQKAAVASAMANLESGGRPNEGISRKEAAVKVGTSPKSISRYRAIEKESPELAKKVKSGEIGLAEAKREIESPAPVTAESAIESVTKPTLGDKKHEKRRLEKEKLTAYITETVEGIMESFECDNKEALTQAFIEGYGHAKRNN